MIEQMWALLTTFTDEAKQAALSKCQELSFDQNRGVVSLDESYINLHSATDILKDAIETKKLIQLPISIQKMLVVLLEAIQKYQTSLTAGSDEVVNLADAIEKLNTYVWQYGLHNLSDQVLGYQSKMNQLKAMELAATETSRSLQQGTQLKEQLEQILVDATTRRETLQTHLDDASRALVETNEALAQTVAKSLKATEALATIQQSESKSTELLGISTSSNTAILGFEKHINDLVAGFTTLKGDIESNKVKQQELFSEFEVHRNKINDLLGDANRTGMAASFTSRRRWLIAPLFSWIAVFGSSIYGLYLLGATYLAPILSSANWEQLPARLALTAPLIWLGWFSAKQYGYTSRLREDYAYKEASAKSFEGYKREAGEVNPEMLKNLLDTAIKNLGHNPIRIYDGHENHASPLNELLDKSLKDEKVMDLLKAIIARGKS